MNVRDRGVYCLPNGRTLVVFGRSRNEHIKFRLIGWEDDELTEYEVNDEGRLLCQGKLTAWNIDDLKDTGRTASSVNDAVEHY